MALINIEQKIAMGVLVTILICRQFMCEIMLYRLSLFCC